MNCDRGLQNPRFPGFFRFHETSLLIEPSRLAPVMPGFPYKPKSSIFAGFTVWTGLFAVIALTLLPGCKPRQTSRVTSGVPDDHGESTSIVGKVGPPEFRGSPARPESDFSSPTPDEETLKSMAAGPWAEKLDPYIPSLSTPKGNKMQTLTVAAIGPKTRHAYFTVTYNNLIDADQVRQVEDIVDSYDRAYEDLMRRRHQILEQNRNGEIVKQLLMYNSAAMLAVNFEIRSVIFRTVLTPEQQAEFNARYSASSTDADTSQDAGPGQDGTPDSAIQ